ncbi:glycosyltransferase family 2 protein [Haloplanus halobius]|uniref:glycosyltransferase family 2 protein n=1 Tax=Haloplanus halobius TaxID=2934938 RepID=UPI00200C0519|nr:glycosyltransferase family 2 protein [Haloplanus sp. XH21]
MKTDNQSANGGGIERGADAGDARTNGTLATSAGGVLLPADSELTPTLSVVLPTLNEEDGIGECIDRIIAALETLEIHGEIVVSDSSTDRTPEIAREKGAIVVEPDKPGYGYAYQYAFDRCRGEYIAMGDADTTYDFEELPKLYRHVAEDDADTTYDFEELPKLYRHVAEDDADMAMGSRLNGEIKDGAMPALHQYVGNPLLTAFLNTFYDTDVSDAHSGIRVFSRDALDAMDLSTTGMEFASEMIMESGASDLTIAEEPITYHEREGEATLDSFQDGWRHVRFMLENAPGYLFTGPGIALLVFGLAVIAGCLANVSIGPAGFGLHSLIAGSLFVVIGFQAITLGVFAKLSGDPVRNPSDPLTTLLVEHLSLEHSLAAGIGVFGLGSAYATFMAGRWVGSGFRTLPLVEFDIVAMTAIVVGILAIFNSFFLSIIVEESASARDA